MTTTTYGALLGLVCLAQIVLLATRPERLCRGLVTRMMARIPGLGWFFRLNSTSMFPLAFGTAKRALFVAIVSELAIRPLSDPTVAELFYYLMVTLLFLDDYVTGGDDDWRKRWQEVRNKVKWKMELPQPATERSGTA